MLSTRYGAARRTLAEGRSRFGASLPLARELPLYLFGLRGKGHAEPRQASSRLRLHDHFRLEWHRDCGEGRGRTRAEPPAVRPGRNRVFRLGRPAIPRLAGALPSSSPQDVAARAFAADVVRLSGEADGVDRLWRAYKAECGVREGRQYDFGRAWFALWDRSAEPTVVSPVCSGILWRLLQSGEGVRRELLEARAVAKRAALPTGTEIGMLRWNGLQWLRAEETLTR